MVRTKVFVGNLAFSTKEPELAAAFATAGKVIGANIITRGPRSLGYGFVEMESEEDAQKAVQLMNKKDLNGRQINVEVAKPQEETKEKESKKPQGENGAEEKTGRRKSGYRKKSPQQGEKESKKEVGNASPKVSEEDRPRKRRTRNKRTHEANEGQKKPETEKQESKTTLFIANLPFSLDDEGFAKIINEIGVKPKSAHVVKKRNGRSKGYGFVEFENEADQKKSLDNLNKKQVEGRELSVKIALTEVGNPDVGSENKPAPEKKAEKPVPEKKAPAEKKVDKTPEKKSTAPPAEKKTTTPASPSEKKATTPASPSEKKTTTPASPSEKKTTTPTSPPEKKAQTEAKKSTTPSEKKISSPSEKKTASAEKKETPTKNNEKK